MTIGKLRLSSAEEDDLVAFLETLTDVCQTIVGCRQLA
jgi:hypothetical protein